jgi:hypothetical protein
MRRLLTLGLLALAAAACTSPEATRLQAGGRGADPGNRRQVVRMHEGSDPYWHTPQRISRHEKAPVDSARQADRLSRSAPEPATSPAEPGK